MTRFRRKLQSIHKNVNLIFSEGSIPKTIRGTSDNVVFEPVQQTLTFTVSNCVIVPGKRLYGTEFLIDFYGAVGDKLKLIGNNKLDCETFYFLKDYNEDGNSVSTDLSSGALWAYTFTGWHIKNTPLSTASSTYIKNGNFIPAQTVFQPGDVITPEVLKDYGILDENGQSTGISLQLEALWGKCYFISNNGGSTTGNDITKPKSFNNAYSIQGTSPKYAYDVVYMLISNINYTKFSSSNTGFTVKSLQATYSNDIFIYNDGQKYTFNQTSGGDSKNTFRFRLDNIICSRNCLATQYYWFTSNSDSSIPLYIERTARNEGYFGTFASLVKTLFVLNGGRCKNAEWLGYGNVPSYNLDVFLGRNCYFSSDVLLGVNGGTNVDMNYNITLTITGGKYNSISLENTAGNYNKDITLFIYGNGIDDSEYNPIIEEIYSSKRRPIGGNAYIYINGCSNILNIYGGGGEYTANANKNVYLQIYNSKVKGNVHVGGKYAGLTGVAYLDMKNSTIYGNLYGSSMAATSISNANSFFVSNQQLSNTPNTNIKNPPTGFPKYNNSDYSVLIYKCSKVTWWSYEGSGGYNIAINDYTAKLSNATASNIDISIENCIIGDKTDLSGNSGNIYGGGLDSIISGNAKIYIKNTTIYGSVYGGGNGLAQPEPVKLCQVLSASEYTAPTTKAYYDIYISDNTVLELNQTPNPLTDDTYGEYYTWSNDESVLNMGGIDSANKLIYSPNFSNWGDVNGDVSITIIGGNIKGNVYAGGNAANIGGNTTMSIGYDALIEGNVIGSGENSITTGNSIVNINNSTVQGSIIKVAEGSTISGTIHVTVNGKEI